MSATQTITGGLCGVCRFWKKDEGDEYGECMRLPTPLISLTGQIKNEENALVYPGNAALLTRATFGCNQYKARTVGRGSDG